jgi:hypothetical protein
MNSDALELSELGAGRARRPSSGSLKRQTSREHNSSAAAAAGERSPNGPSGDPTKTLLVRVFFYSFLYLQKYFYYITCCCVERCKMCK